MDHMMISAGGRSQRQSYCRVLEWKRQFTIQLFHRRTHRRMVRRKITLPTVS